MNDIENTASTKRLRSTILSLIGSLRMLQSCLGYLMFVIFIFVKLRILHSHLHARYIDMNFLDDIIAVGSVILVSFWTLWLPQRARSISLAALNVLLTLLIFSDLVYYRYFGDFITIPVLLQAGQVGELGDSIQSLIHWQDLWLIADWLVWVSVILWSSLRRIHRRSHTQLSLQSHGKISSSKAMLKRFITGIAAFIIGFIMTMGPIKHYANTWAGELFEGNWWNMSLYNVTGLLGFHYYDTYRFTKEHLLGKPALSAEEMDEIKEWFNATRPSRYEPNETYGAYAGSNVVVIQAEAFMNFMIGKSIDGQEITPNFNKLMNESLYFSSFYHQTGQGRTSDADFSSQTSLHPLPTGSVFVRYPEHTYDALPLILKKNGYETSAFHAYEGSFWNRTNMYRELGYDRFYTKKDYILDEPLGWSLGDQSFFRQSLHFMSQNQQPFYSFLITLSSHHPYSLPQKMQSLNTGEFEGTIFGDYLQSVHYVDAALGQFVEEMKEAGLWDNTILYFYGDHDNSITEKADYEKFLGKSLSYLDLHQIMNQVPLLIHLPDGQLTGVHDEPAGQLDMAPSLLHLLGISTEQDYMMGNNLFNSKERLIVQRSGAFSSSELYYIPSSDSRFDNGSCYDLNTRELTTVEQCRIPYDEAKKRLSISDAVIASDILTKLRAESQKK